MLAILLQDVAALIATFTLPTMSLSATIYDDTMLKIVD